MSEPIRVGDRFQDAAGKVWRCIETKPFGKRDFMLEGAARFFSTTTAQLRLNPMTRLVSPSITSAEQK